MAPTASSNNNGCGSPTNTSHNSANANKTNQSKGVFVWANPNKGIGINNTTEIPSFGYNGGYRKVCIKFATRRCNCIFGSHCNKFHLSERIFLNFSGEKQDQADALVAFLSNIALEEGITKKERSATKANLNSSNSTEGGGMAWPALRNVEGKASAAASNQG
jgi:hypothetical protein